MSDHDDDFYTPPPFDEDITHLDDEDAPAPERVANYRILQRVGEGGMGLVYEAEQQAPVRRKVALKVIKLGMDTAQVVARFESERQALALMDHPNIARVFDAGVTERGSPFFAMEFVRGQAITEYCDRTKLGTHDRLKLFLQLCDGVHHAHQKGIIHRDLKPSNVLVREQDDKPVPKIIDFGIAKATASQRLTDKTVFTEMGQLIGTPEYMSPEQAEMGVMDIDTRTDVYLLGVMLYELLSGTLPFDASEIRRTGLNEFRRQVIEVDPPRPSTRLSGTDQTIESTAGNRQSLPRALQRQLRGDLDWITMKALEKDRTRRYASANELAQDIRRYLKHEPVIASPPGNVYRIKKFVRRHKAGVAFAAVLAVLLTGFAVSMALLATRLAAERRVARQEAATAQVVSDFLEGLFAVSNPSEALGNTITAREILDRGAESIEHDLVDQPEVQARLMHTMGSVYAGLGLGKDARPLIEHALEIRQKVLGPEHPDVAATMDSLAGVVAVNFGDLIEARRLHRRALEIRQASLGPDDPSVASSMNNLAILLDITGEHDQAIEMFTKAFEIWERTLGPDDPNTLIAMNNRALLLGREGRHDEAEQLLLRFVAARERSFGRAHPKVADALVNLALNYEEVGDHAAARTHYDRALEIRERVYGDSHRKVGDTVLRLAMIDAREGKRQSADALRARAVAVFERADILDSPFTIYDLACFDGHMGRKTDALAQLRRAVVENDYKARDELLAEPAFAAWHDDPEFKLILAGVDVRTGSRPEPADNRE